MSRFAICRPLFYAQNVEHAFDPAGVFSRGVHAKGTTVSVTARADGQPSRRRAAPTWTSAGRIDTRDDVDRLLATVTAAGQRRDRTAGLIRVVDRADNITLSEPDGARVLPVAAELVELLPWPGGIRRGATVAATGSMSLVLALLADAMAQGAWAAIVGAPAFAPTVSIEYGLELSRLALVPRPGDEWPDAVAALVDGLDIVVVATPADVPVGIVKSMTARARRRGCVLVPTTPWPGCDVTCGCSSGAGSASAAAEAGSAGRKSF